VGILIEIVLANLGIILLPEKLSGKVMRWELSALAIKPEPLIMWTLLSEVKWEVDPKNGLMSLKGRKLDEPRRNLKLD
jgi:hypothetical protein